MHYCAFCFESVDDQESDMYREVSSWVTGPKLDSPVLREQTGRVAHGRCVQNLVHGQAPEQPEIFDLDEGESSNASPEVQA